MGNPTGFLEIGRVNFERRPVEERIQDWKEVYKAFPQDKLQAQASRCMDCGIPFCHQGCPLGNIIPDWNDLVYRGQWQEALYRLLATNNFPNSPEGFAPRRVKAHACWGSTKTRSLSKTSKLPSLTRHSKKDGSAPGVRKYVPERQ